MKPKSVLKIIVLYFYMYFIGPLIWGVWMAYRLKVITVQEYLHCLFSLPALMILSLFFVANTIYIIRLRSKVYSPLSESEKRHSNRIWILKINTVSVVSFGTAGTIAFMSMLSTNSFSLIKISIGDWMKKAVIGSLSGTALVFLFYILFSTIIITTIIESIYKNYEVKLQEVLIGLKNINKLLYTIGLTFFIGTSAASLIYNGDLAAGHIVTYKNMLFLFTLAFPILMSWLLFKKSSRKIDSIINPLHGRKQGSLKSVLQSTLRIKAMVQIAGLLLFIFLLIMQTSRLWMIVFGAGFISSLLLGRIYCGWLCPVNTLSFLINKLLKKLNINKPDAPEWMKSKLAGTIIFLLFLIFFILSLAMRIRLQLFPVISLLGVIVSIGFASSVWCNYLCPWGTIFKKTSRFSFFRLQIKPQNCIRCRKCEMNCPSKSVKISLDNQAIDFSTCLQCLECKEKCHKKAIGIERCHL